MKVLIIDFYNFIFRGLFRFTHDEMPDHQVFAMNFFRNLRPIIEQFKSDKYIIAAEGYPQFRYDLFPEYKLSRKSKTNHSFSPTKNLILDILPMLPLTLARASSYEADDLIYTILNKHQDDDVTVVSSDTDFMQLKKCKVYNAIKKQFMSPPEYDYRKWKILNGDKSDNIPKIVTPKKAIELASDESKLKTFLSVKENKEKYDLNEKLISFVNVPEEQIIYKQGELNPNALYDKFSELKYDSIIKSWDKFISTFG